VASAASVLSSPGVGAILLVDDNAAKRLALRAVLSQLGHPIVEADSGRAALRCLMTQDFAVILLDVCMPVMDGFETAALIRQRRQSELTPIIFITAFASDEIGRTDRYAEGAVDFIFAPVPPEELRAKVSVFVNIFSKAEALATQAREVQASADQLRLLTDAAPVGIFQTDADNRYVYTNPRWSETTGIQAEEAVGQQWAPSSAPSCAPTSSTSWRTVRPTGLNAATASRSGCRAWLPASSRSPPSPSLGWTEASRDGSARSPT